MELAKRFAAPRNHREMNLQSERASIHEDEHLLAIVQLAKASRSVDPNRVTFLDRLTDAVRRLASFKRAWLGRKAFPPCANLSVKILRQLSRKCRLDRALRGLTMSANPPA